MITRWLENITEERRIYYRRWGQRISVMSLIGLYLLLGTLALSLDALISDDDIVRLNEGDVADRDILAPRSLIYDSDYLTEQARQEAITAVEPVYDPDPDVTRAQIRLAGEIREYITQVRADPYAPDPQLIADLMAIQALNAPEDTWQALLTLPDNRWELVGAEILSLVERTMQGDIRRDNVEVVRNNLVNSVATRFMGNEIETEVIVAITSDIIQPNTFYNSESTAQRQEEAANRVNIQQRSFEEGQVIVRGGTIVGAQEMEALRQFGLLKPRNIRIQVLVSAFLAISLTTLVFWLYLRRFHARISRDLRSLVLMGTLFLLFLFSAYLFGGQPYLYPAPALALLLTSLIGFEVALTAITLLALLVGITFPPDQTLEMVSLIMIGSTAGMLSMRREERFNSYFVAGLIIGLANLIIMLVFAFHADESPSLADLATRGFTTAISGLFAAGIALVLLYVITNVMNLATSLKLVELMDAKHPLLQRLLREAPGTYQHSLQVGNLGELAAEAIGANAHLIRVAAMYHDIGKMLNPYYFSENTVEGMNPHQDLSDPYQSARVIIGHVIEGERLAKRYNLPGRIRDFILEHHGTTQVLFFYNQAIENVQAESEVNIEDFTYPGPAPRSRETAIVMLADGCESATRSRNPSAKADIEEMVNTIFELRLSEGQLDNSGLTLNDLKMIRNIFIETLQAMYHPRIAYKMRKKVDDQKPQLNAGIVKNLEAGSKKGDKQATSEMMATVKHADETIPTEGDLPL